MRVWSERVRLRTHAATPRAASLREPRGEDELALQGVDTRAAVAFLDRLLEQSPPAGDLSASDRDGLLAALHRGLWGDRVVSTLDCAACGAPYDLAFELSALQQSLEAGREAAAVVEPRVLETSAGFRLRLPDAAEEDEAAQLGPALGRARLAAAVAGPEGADDPQLEPRLEALAPLIDVDVEAPCAECGHPALARFDVQSFVLQRLLDEREGLLGEIHTLAGAYGWSLTEILGLPRSLRRAMTEQLGQTAAASL